LVCAGIVCAGIASLTDSSRRETLDLVTAGRLIQLRGWVAFGLAVVYVVAGGIGLFAGIDDSSDRVIWLVLLWGGAAVIFAGIFLANAVGRVAALLLSLGAAAGGLALFWTFLVPVGVAAVIALSVVIVRRAPKPA
jgi:hypothetical protein